MKPSPLTRTLVGSALVLALASGLTAATSPSFAPRTLADDVGW
jgi:hypothetical protein